MLMIRVVKKEREESEEKERDYEKTHKERKMQLRLKFFFVQLKEIEATLHGTHHCGLVRLNMKC